MGIPLGISQSYKTAPLSQIFFTMSSMGHLFTPPNSVVDRLDQSVFRVDESPQGFGGGHSDGGGFKGGKTGKDISQEDISQKQDMSLKNCFCTKGSYVTSSQG